LRETFPTLPRPSLWAIAAFLGFVPEKEQADDDWPLTFVLDPESDGLEEKEPNEEKEKDDVPVAGEQNAAVGGEKDKEPVSGTTEAKEKKEEMEDEDEHSGTPRTSSEPPLFFKCPVDTCTFSTKHPYSLHRHIGRQHSNSDLRAYLTATRPPTGPPVFRRDTGASDRNLLEEHPVPPFKCTADTCTFSTYYPGNLATHIRWRHAPSTGVPCAVQGCDKRVHSRIEYERHLASAHPSVNPRELARRERIERTVDAEPLPVSELYVASADEEKKAERSSSSASSSSEADEDEDKEAPLASTVEEKKAEKPSTSSSSSSEAEEDEEEEKETPLAPAEQPLFKCHVARCTFVSHYKGNLNKHIRGQHPAVAKHLLAPKLTMLIKCTLGTCAFSMDHLFSLRRHLRLQHAPSTDVRCGVEGCSTVLGSRQEYSAHLATAHPLVSAPIEPVQGGELDVASAAEEKKADASSSDHQDDADDGTTTTPLLVQAPVFKCTVGRCQFATTYRGNLLQHLRRRHPSNTRIRCPVIGCDAVHGSAAALNQHMTAAHPELMIACPRPGCMHRCKYPSNLQKHIESVHVSGYAYLCPVDGCGHGTRSRGELTRHVRDLHSAEKTL
jgi:hypothetical protein